MQNNFTWYLKFHAGWPTIFSQVQRSFKIYSIMLSLIWHHLCMVHFHRFESLMSTRGHYLPQSDQSHVRCEVSKLRETVIYLHDCQIGKPPQENTDSWNPAEFTNYWNSQIAGSCDPLGTVAWELWRKTKFSPCYHKELTWICFGGGIYWLF